MSEEDDPLALDGNWHRLCISGDASAMEQWGPNLKVSIAAVTQQGATLAHHEVGALIDTGSKSSCISPRLAPKMEGGLRGVRSLPHIYGLLEGPPTIRGLVRFKNGVDFIRDFSVLDHLAPYDVLIGRDILTDHRHRRFLLRTSRDRKRHGPTAKERDDRGLFHRGQPFENFFKRVCIHKSREDGTFSCEDFIYDPHAIPAGLTSDFHNKIGQLQTSRSIPSDW